MAGLILLGWSVFRLGEPASQCIFMGALASLIFGLIRVARPIQALSVVGAFGLLQIGLTWSSGLIRCVATVGWSLFIALGFYLVAVIFDRLARLDFRFGKFLVAGPLLGGIYFAATPLASFAMVQSGQVVSIWQNALLGIAIGDGVGLGIELLELLPGLGGAGSRPAEPHSGEAAVPAPDGDGS